VKKALWFLAISLLFVACAPVEEGEPIMTGDGEVGEQEVVDDDLSDQSDQSDQTDLSDQFEFPDEPVDDTVVDEIPDIDEPSVEFDPPDLTTAPVAYIVTVEAFRKTFELLAILHSAVGLPTAVATIEDICGGSCDDGDPRNDTAAAIKAWAQTRPGLQHLILGGDIEVVPSRAVHDKYSNIVAGTYEEDFKTDHYYADLSEWDGNHNGIYAEDAGDSPDLLPELAVSRIPVSDDEEAARYVAKVRRYLTAYNSADMQKALLIANVATNYNGIDINAGYYFENEGRTVDTIPTTFTIRRLYAQTLPPPSLSAETLTLAKEEEALEAGTNIVVHNGHGYPSLLTCEQVGDALDFTGAMAYALTNQTPLVFLSCACQAGQFEAPFTWHYTNSAGEAKEKVFTDDSAGELLVNAPNGGAVIYLGNTTTGLGLAGGSQLIDEMLKYAFANPRPLAGDAFRAARIALPQNDTFTPPVVAVPLPVVDPDSWAWTQKAVVLLGDGALPLWTVATPVSNLPIFSVEKVNGGARITLSHIPEGATARIHFCGNYYTVAAGDSEKTVTAPGDCLTAEAALSSPTTQYWFDSISVL